MNAVMMDPTYIQKVADDSHLIGNNECAFRKVAEKPTNSI